MNVALRCRRDATHMLRQSAYPRSDPGNPARNIGAKDRIRSPECPLQRRFLVQHNVKVGCGPEQRAVCDETPIAEQKSLASNDNYDWRRIWDFERDGIGRSRRVGAAAQRGPACLIPQAQNAQMNLRSRECLRG